MWTRACGALALAAVGVALGCGGGGEDKDKEAASRDCAPAPAAMSGQPALPTGFPQPAEVTYTGQVAKAFIELFPGMLCAINGSHQLRTGLRPGYGDLFTNALFLFAVELYGDGDLAFA